MKRAAEPTDTASKRPKQEETPKVRCSWPGEKKTDELMLKYHDEEWGAPLRDDHKIFEHLTLSNFQAGLTFSCVLKKRQAMREAFDNFDPTKVALYDSNRIKLLMENEKIIRNKSKISCTVTNAKQFLKVQEEHGSFHSFIWQFVGNKVLDMQRTGGAIPAKSPEAEELSKALKKKGFKFVGPTIIYAFMNEIGMVNNHMTKCYRHAECLALGVNEQE
jgi:DNA-3-methyladenine glycosylase I